MNKRVLKRVITISVILVLTDQLLKIYVSANLQIVGQTRDLIGDFLRLYHVSTRVSILNLTVNSAIGILAVYLLIRFSRKKQQSALFLYSLAFISTGFLSRVFDLVTIGHFGNTISGGYNLITIDPLYINFYMFTTYVSFSSIVLHAGVFTLTYTLITNFIKKLSENRY